MAIYEITLEEAKERIESGETILSRRTPHQDWQWHKDEWRVHFYYAVEYPSKKLKEPK